jgi:outer membrane protein OmpA-like peptidoglycan-associated protein
MKRRHLLPLLLAPFRIHAENEERVISATELARKWRRTKSLTDPVVETRRTIRRVKKGITLEEEIVEVRVDADTETRFTNILFALNSDRLEGAGTHAQLAEIAQAMRLAGSELFLIEGHTCDLGDLAYNKDLSQRRAEAVVAALAALQVPRERLDAIGFGEEKPLETAPADAAREKNRRVQIYRKV